MSAQQNITLKLQLKTITPISIGSDKGDALSPYADYVFSNNGKQLHYLDLRKIENAVHDANAHDANAIDEYVASIYRSMDNNRSEFDLEHFLTGRLKKNVSDFTLRTVPQYGLTAGQRVPISPIVKNAGQPYLPGSSIKGALRTAILYDWLVNTKDGGPELEQIGKLVEQLDDKRKTINDLRKGPRRFEQDTKRQIKELDKEAKRLENRIFDEEKLFGSLKTGPDAQFIRVSDTQPVDDKLEVYALRRIRIVPGKGKSAIPQVLEAIPANVLLHFDLSILPAMRHPALDYWKKGNYREIFNNLASFSRACIAAEIYDLDDALQSEEEIGFENDIERLLEFYRDLEERANNGEIFLRLGFGKTVNDNSLILALLNGLENDNAWHHFRAAFHKIYRKDKFFPVTRTLTPGGMPMGWVKIEKT